MLSTYTVKILDHKSVGSFVGVFIIYVMGVRRENLNSVAESYKPHLQGTKITNPLLSVKREMVSNFGSVKRGVWIFLQPSSSFPTPSRK